MAGFLRGKQAGIQNDLSSSLRPELFTPDDQARYGIDSQISCFAYDPVQSLLAIGTRESKFGPGKVYVFGRERIQKVLEPPRRSTFRSVHFSAGRLVTLDAKNELGVWDLDSGARVAAQVIGGPVGCMVTDPMLDWSFIGLQNGDVMAYDLDRHNIARAFRLPNFWRDKDPMLKSVTLVCMSIHPRDVGKLLIGYNHGAVVYSFKQNKATHFLDYVLPPGAPGGNSLGMDAIRRPRLTHALWHPSGTFIVTAHEDGSIVFWDPKEGKVVMARTLSDMGVDHVTGAAGRGHAEPCVQLAWCCKTNPDDTALLVAGGQDSAASPKCLTFIELGQTPIYATSSWQALSDHFRGRRQIPLNLPPGAQAVDFLLIPRESPHFGGAQDPVAVIVLLTSGELITMSFPSGYPISPTNQLHPSTFFVQPFIAKMNVTSVERPRWLSMIEKRDQGEPILKGGAEGVRPRKRYEERTILQSAHGDGTIRIWDSGHADEIENPSQLQVDVARALNRWDDVDITAMSMASGTGEFVVGTRTGEAVVFRWGGNRFYGKRQVQQLDPNPMGLSDVSSRAEPGLKEGLQPFVLYEMMQGPITAVKVSSAGFAAMGSELGFLSLIDLRGPRIIYQAPMTDFVKQEHRMHFLKSHSRAGSASQKKEWPVVIEFGVMTLDEDKYSSICCFVGTNLGRVITLKLLPGREGTYEAQLAGVAAFEGRVISLNPVEADTGKPAAATGATVAGLREGRQVNGAVVAVTAKEVRIFKPAHSKGASRDFDDDLVCHAASVAELELQGVAVVAVLSDATARAYSIPGLRDLGRAPLPMAEGGRLAEAMVTQTGDIFAWTGPSEMAVVHVWGTGKGLEQSSDKLINPALTPPPRPTISNLAWISGTQYVSPLDLDLLVGGPDRPPSKRMMDAAAEEKRAAGNERGATQQAEGWGDYLTRQLNERTEKLNIMGDSLDDLQAQSAGWAEDVERFIGRQKRNFVLGAVKSKFM